ncbi:hypothetical protein EG832_17195, partial [bacterium]|nr:hypothetical protein [bacterium]
MNEKRGYGFLITGLLVGLILGLAYAWFIDPVSYSNTSPSTLREDFRDQYRLLIARSFAYNQDLGRSAARISLLGDEDPQQALVSQAQKLVANDGKRSDAEALAALANALGGSSNTDPTPTINSNHPSETPGLTTPTVDTENAIRTATPQPVTEGKTPVPTFTPRAGVTLNPVVNLPFVLDENEVVCNPNIPERLLQVEVLDENENPLAGVRITVTWEGGEDIFFTGLHPEMGPGYADFEMSQGIVYSVKVGDSSKPVTGLWVTSCIRDDGTSYLGGVKLIFK